MKRCLECGAHYLASLDSCPDCRSQPPTKDGFVSYAPKLADNGEGFKKGYFAELANLEEKNFWFRARNDLITWVLGKYGVGFQSFLEIGCGTGYVLSGVAERYPTVKLYGSEIFVEGLHYASQRAPSATMMQMDARNIPYYEEFDCIGAFDVLEHIENDTRVLAELYSALKPSGTLLLTVPQHRWLWSMTDEFACHVRRYSAHEIHNKVEVSGFSIVRSTSFVSLLLPMMLLSRIRAHNRSTRFDPLNELKLPKTLNDGCLGLMQAEIALIRRGVNFPAGGSRLIVARKK